MTTDFMLLRCKVVWSFFDVWKSIVFEYSEFNLTITK